MRRRLVFSNPETADRAYTPYYSEKEKEFANFLLSFAKELGAIFYPGNEVTMEEAPDDFATSAEP